MREPWSSVALRPSDRERLAHQASINVGTRLGTKTPWGSVKTAPLSEIGRGFVTLSGLAWVELDEPGLTSQSPVEPCVDLLAYPGAVTGPPAFRLGKALSHP